MEKEKVLEIEITKINDNWSCWFVKNMNKKILKNGWILVSIEEYIEFFNN